LPAPWAAAENIIDFSNHGKFYSSNYILSENNPDGVFIAAWTNSKAQIKSINLYPRLDPEGLVLGFPKEYSVYLTSPDNKSWIDLGIFKKQPQNNIVKINLDKQYSTYGVSIRPVKLWKDHAGYIFQLAGIELSTKQQIETEVGIRAVCCF